MLYPFKSFVPLLYVSEILSPINRDYRERKKKKVMLLRDYGWSWITKGDIFAGGGACSSVGFLISVMYKSVIFLSQLLTAFGDSYRVPGFVSFLKKNC